MKKCPYCQGTGTLLEMWAPEVSELRSWCEEDGIEVAPDGTVSQKDAARLVDKSPFTVRNWRAYGLGGPEAVKIGGRYRYSLEAIAKWRAGEEED